MYVAPSAASTGQPNRFITCPCKSVRYSSHPSLQQASISTLRYRSLVMCVSINHSDGEPAKNTDSNKETSNQPSVPPASPSPPLPKAPNWLKWTMGSIVWLALPSWKSIQSVQGLLSRVDVAVETIEAVAEVTEKIASDVADQLPDGDGLKKVMVGLENASEHLLKNAQMIDAVIDKVEEFEEKIRHEDRKGEEDSREGSVAMDSISQETSRSTQSKRVWTELEDEKLIESMLDLHNTGRYTAEGGFKSEFFIEVGKALAIALPNARIKVDPHIKSRVKTLKTNFAIVWDMLYGPNTSGFGYDDTTKCVVAERPVWDAYIQSHKKAHIFKDRPFPHFEDLCIIFGKDRTTVEHAVAPGDLMEDNREEEVSSLLNNVEGDGLDGMEFSLPEGQEPDIGSPGNNSEAGTSRKRKKKKGGPVDDALVEVIERASTFMGESMKESAIIMSDAITDAKVNEMKQQLPSELAKIEGLSMTDLVRATSKIVGDRNNTLIFYRFTPEQRVEFVKTILE